MDCAHVWNRCVESKTSETDQDEQQRRLVGKVQNGARYQRSLRIKAFGRCASRCAASAETCLRTAAGQAAMEECHTTTPECINRAVRILRRTTELSRRVAAMSTRDLLFERPMKEKRKHVDVDWTEIARHWIMLFAGMWWRCISHRASGIVRDFMR